MDRHLIITEDGSHSLFVPELDEHYHSTHGAIQESMHVFIQSGLYEVHKSEITIFEVGFGTGLNALLTFLKMNEQVHIKYVTVEKFPLTIDEITRLNYASILDSTSLELFYQMHSCQEGIFVPIGERFELFKIYGDLADIQFSNLPAFDLVYFDAFAPGKQPEMWNHLIFQDIYNQSSIGALFVTYCAKGSVRRDLQSVGYIMERIPGPPGKMEMLRGRV